MDENKTLLSDANEIIETLCDAFLDLPCGCESCPLYEDRINRIVVCDKVKWQERYKAESEREDEDSN